MKKSLLAATILTVASASAFADYQIEGKFSFDRTEYDPTEIDTISIGGDFYLEKVNTANVLLAEAAFLDKASHAGATFNMVEIAGLDADNIGVDGRFILKGDKDFIIEANLAFGDWDVIGIAGGLYLDDQTEVIVGFNNNDFGAADFSTFYVKGKTVLNASNGNAIVAQGLVQIQDGEFGFQGEGDYYLSNQTSVGGVAGIFLGDGFSPETRVVAYGQAQHFLSEQIAIEGKFGFVDLVDSLKFQVGVTGRF